MSSYTYDPETLRVLRQRSALYKHSGHTYSPNAGIRQDLQYTYDLEGTITTTNDAAPANTYAQGPGNLLRKFNHDPLRRLISATGREISNVYQQPSWDLNIRPMDYTDTNTYTRSYQYDKLGNIQYLSHKAAGHTNQDFDRDYTYDGSDNKLRAFTVNSNLFQNKYDPSGNLAQEGQSRFYEWTANDKMAVFKTQAGSSTPSVFTNYFYNSQGERIKKHTRKGNKVIVTFYMDGGMFETSYVKPTGGNIDNNRFYNSIKIEDEGALIATLRVGKNVDDHTPEIKYIVGDHLNNSTAVLKTTGTLINREEFYPFGETSFGGFQYKRYRYNGKEKDEESGLYEYGQRYYAPWLCRFVRVDPIAEDYPQLSSYNYAGNKPITSPDIEGLQGTEDAPVDSSTQSQGSTETSNAGLLNIEVHQVQKGETLSQIAADNDISVESLREANNLDPANDRKLQIGTELNIPATVQQSTTDSTLSFSDSFNFLDSGLSFEVPELKSEKSDSVSDIANPISLGMGVVGEGLELSKSTFRLKTSTKLISPKIYSNGWRGNQYTNTFRFAKLGKLLGWGGFAVSFGADIYGLRQYYLHGADAPNAVTPAKAGVNTAVGLYGLTPTVGGAIIAPIYFGLETFYPGGTDQALKDKAQRDEKTSKILGRPFNSANQGTYSPFKW